MCDWKADKNDQNFNKQYVDPPKNKNKNKQKKHILKKYRKKCNRYLN